MIDTKFDTTRFLKFIIGTFLVLFLWFSVYKNQFGVVQDNFYSSFDQFSESLVLGKIIADKNNKELKPFGNLAFATMGDSSWDPEYFLQSYLIIGNKEITEIHTTLDQITDRNWIKGISKNFPGIVVKNNNLLSLYLGKEIDIPDLGTRTIASIRHSGPYSNIYLSGSILDPSKVNMGKQIRISGGTVNSDLIEYRPYHSQFGLQGIIFSKIYTLFSDKLSFLYKINAFLFALVIIALVYAYIDIFSFEFALVFLLTMALSPWITSMAKNLYWISFSWFLPALFGAYIYLAKTKIKKITFIILLYLSFVIKCLSGYEYISTIILLAAAPFLYAQISLSENGSKLGPIKMFLGICLIGTLGFITALLFHANMIGASLFDGLNAIYQFDVKRRTYGDPNLFPSSLTPSLSSSVFDVLRIYFYNWHTDIIKGVPGTLFNPLFCFAVLVIIYRFISLHSQRHRDLGIFVAFLLPPLSWLILAKAHSFIHTQLNFVLWYFGTIAAIFYICLVGLKIGLIYISNWSKNKNPSYV
jgi:hypothetical protein